MALPKTFGRKPLSRFAALLAAAGLVLAAPPPGRAATVPPPRPAAKAWVLIDARDGTRLTGRNTARRLPVASATKLMTAQVAMASLDLDRRLRAPAYRANPAESRINLREGERMTVRDLLYALILESANDAAVTLARGTARSVPRFVRRMNREARRLGLGDTRFANPIGLDDPANHSSARDLARLARILLRRPTFARIADTGRRTLRSGRRAREIATRNRLVLRVPWITGVKTGRTLGAGYVLVGSGTRMGIPLVSVVLGAPSEAARDRATLDLLEWGFGQYRRATPVRRGDSVATVPVASGGELRLSAARTLPVQVRRGQRLSRRPDVPRRVEGPIDRGQRLGEVTVTVDGEPAGRVPLVASRAVAAPSAIDEALDAIPGPLPLMAVGALLALLGIGLALRRGRA